VEGFIALADRLREEQKDRAAVEEWGDHCIGVHCHYGKLMLMSRRKYTNFVIRQDSTELDSSSSATS